MTNKKFIISILFVLCFLLINISTLVENENSPLKNSHSKAFSKERNPEKSGITQAWNFTPPANRDDRRVAISSDSNYIITLAWSSLETHIVYFFHKSSSTPLWTYTTPYAGQAGCVAISSNGSYAAVGTDDGLYFFNTSNILNPFLWFHEDVGGDQIDTVAISSNGMYLITENRRGTIHFYNRTSSNPMWDFTVEEDESGGSVAITPDGKYVAVGDDGGKIYFFNTSVTSPKIPLWKYNIGFYGIVYSLSFSNDGKYLAASINTRVLLFNTTNFLSPLLWLYNTGFYAVRSVSISSDGTYIAAGGDRFRLFDKSKSNPIWTINTGAFVSVVSISSDGKYIAIGSDNNNEYLLYTPTFSTLWTFATGGDIESIAMSFTGIYFIAGSLNDKFYLFHNSRTPFSFQLTTDADTPDLDGNFNLTWTNAIEADNYSVYVSSNFINNIAEAVLLQMGLIELNYSITGKPSDDYYYIILAFNEYGNTSTNCIKIDVRIPPGMFTLNTDATDPEEIGIFNLTWTLSKGADNYSVYQSESFITQIDGSQELLEEGITDLNYTISTYKEIWYYMIVAYNETGNTSSNCISVDVQIPPKLFTLNSNAEPIDTDGTFNLLWDESLGADNYSVYTSDVYITQIETCTLLIGGLKSLTFLQNNLATDDYYYVIVAFNDYGNISSNIICVVVHRFPAAFELSTMAGSPDRDGAFYLNWTSSTDADNYSIYISNQLITEINENIELIYAYLTNFSLWISGLSTGNYYFIAVANNSVGYTLSNCILVKISIPETTNGGGGGGNRKSDGDGTISFGYYYLIFLLAACISLIVLNKRRLGFKQKI